MYRDYGFLYCQKISQAHIKANRGKVSCWTCCCSEKVSPANLAKRKGGVHPCQLWRLQDMKWRMKPQNMSWKCRKEEKNKNKLWRDTSLKNDTRKGTDFPENTNGRCISTSSTHLLLLCKVWKLIKITQIFLQLVSSYLNTKSTK